MDGGVDGQMDVDGMDDYMDDGWMDGQIVEWIMHGQMDGCVDGQMDMGRHSAITLKVSFKIAHIFVFISSLGKFPSSWTLSTNNSIFSVYV